MLKNYVKIIVALVFVSNVMAQNVPSYVPTNGLVGWWPFNGNANDESGNGNNGTNNGAKLTVDRNGVVNSAYYFDSTYISAAVKGIPVGSNPRTISGWFKSDVPLDKYGNVDWNQPVNYYSYIVDYGNASGVNDRFGVDIYSKGYFNFFYGSNNTNSFLSDQSNYHNHNWYFFTLVYDGKQLSVYMNGSEVIKPTALTLNTLSTNFLIGRSTSIKDNFKGTIDDIGIWNRTLTPQEISTLYTGKIPCTPPTALINKPTSPTTFEEGGFVKLQASVGAGYRFQWHKDNVAIVGATDSTYTVTSGGNYTVVVTDQTTACTATSAGVLVTVTPKSTTNIPSYVPKNGLVGYWPFNGNANDESGNGNNGTVNGATLTTDRNGGANKAYSFNGTSDIIDVKSGGILGNSPRSMFGWIKTSGVPSAPDMIPFSLGYSLGNTPNGTFGLGIMQNELSIYGYTTPYDENNIKVTQNIIDNQWHYMGVTYDGLSTLTFYIDGNQVVKKVRDQNKYYATIAGLFFGGWNDNNRHFNGQIDDIVVYNREISQQEITALYSGTSASGLASSKVFVDAPATVNQNQEVEMSISTESLNTTDNVISYQTDFSYDTTRYTYIGSNLVGTLNPAGSVDINTSKKGLLKVGYMTQTSLNGAGSLVKLKFKANNTLGQGIFGLSNFLYNTTAITSLKSDTVTTIDGIPPTAKITYSQNPVRKGDSLLITVKYSEKMAVSPVPQLNLTGQNTLANANLTKVNDTTYTYWWVVEKGNGAVNVNLATGKDLGGNVIVATPTQNANFTVLPTVFGDIDTNKLVQAYDGALALQYSVGLNALPTMDPLPWSNWRIAVANVDTVGNITANDASLILQKSIDKIASFPADAKKRGDAPVAHVTVTQEANQLVFRATGTLYAFNVFMKDNFNAFGQPEVKDKNAMVATNITSTTYNVGLASTTPFAENEPFLVIPMVTNENVQGTMNIVANAQEKTLAYGAAASIATIQNDALVVYPNPTKDVVTIQNAQGKTLRIVDFQGRLVNTQIVTSNAHEVSLKAIATKGEYIFQLIGENNQPVATQKVVMQ